MLDKYSSKQATPPAQPSKAFETLASFMSSLKDVASWKIADVSRDGSGHCGIDARSHDRGPRKIRVDRAAWRDLSVPRRLHAGVDRSGWRTSFRLGCTTHPV